MKKARLGWKVSAVLLSIIVLAACIGNVVAGAHLVDSLALVVATMGVLQYAFGWPRLPQVVWRVFGPIFSLLMIWSVARSVGWFATRLAIKQLTTGQQAATLAALLAIAILGVVFVVPLYRLCDWRARRRQDEFFDTFA